jgi:hypothetical protein
MRFARLRTAALAVVAAVALAAGGCDGTTTTAPSLEPGTTNNGLGASFTLAAVNGGPLPADVRNDAGGRVSVVSGLLSFGNGTFQQHITLSETPVSGTAAIRQSATHGTFTFRGDRIVFRSSDGGQWEGVLAGNRIHYAVPGNNSPVAFTFQRS